MEQRYPSQLLEKAVQEMSKLPSIGRKTALRLLLNMLRREVEEVDNLTNAIHNLRHNVK